MKDYYGNEMTAARLSFNEAVADALMKAGFSVEDTGGGATAWVKELSGGHTIMVTDPGGMDHRLEVGVTCLVGLSSSRGEEKVVEVEGIQEVLDAAASLEMRPNRPRDFGGWVAHLERVGKVLSGACGGSIEIREMVDATRAIEVKFGVRPDDFAWKEYTAPATFWPAAEPIDYVRLISFASHVAENPKGRMAERMIAEQNILWAIGPRPWMGEQYGSFDAWQALREGKLPAHWDIDVTEASPAPAPRG